MGELLGKAGDSIALAEITSIFGQDGGPHARVIQSNEHGGNVAKRLVERARDRRREEPEDDDERPLRLERLAQRVRPGVAGEPDGSRSERCRRISQAFQTGGLKCAIRSRIRSASCF